MRIQSKAIGQINIRILRMNCLLVASNKREDLGMVALTKPAILNFPKGSQCLRL